MGHLLLVPQYYFVLHGGSQEQTDGRHGENGAALGRQLLQADIARVNASLENTESHT